ncbi:hypothetical protein [Konateibacter massiliensis]|uniref:hypothetical protein n=1 Tax=Konateibacter massiliensis TaxID=2002841 RepID=UPI000C14FAA5|nr:hypothetical protein [Konateibacter massiliensis]
MGDVEVKLAEVEQRTKSNTHQIEDIKDEIKEIKSEQKAIYDIAASIKVMATSMDTMKDDLVEVKQGQKELSNKVDNQIDEVKNGQGKLEQKLQERVDAVNSKVDLESNKMKFDLRDFIRDKLFPVILGAGSLGAVIVVLQKLIG